MSGGGSGEVGSGEVLLHWEAEPELGPEPETELGLDAASLPSENGE